MFKNSNICVSSTILALSLLTPQANACMEHYAYDQGFNSGSIFSGSRTAVKVRSLPVQEKVFKVKHPIATIVVIDENSDLKIDYDLPEMAKNVSLQFAATRNVELMEDDIQLTDLNGTATTRFRVKQKGVDTITVTVSGEHEGEVISYSSKIYINAKEATAS